MKSFRLLVNNTNFLLTSDLPGKLVWSAGRCRGFAHGRLGQGRTVCYCLVTGIQLCSLPGSSVHGIFQPRVLERVAISFSRGSS